MCTFTSYPRLPRFDIDIGAMVSSLIEEPHRVATRLTLTARGSTLVVKI